MQRDELPQPWKNPPEDLKKQGFGSKSDMRHNIATVNEDQNWTANARFANVPVWAGPSGTTYNMCRFVQREGQGGSEDIIACAYGIFALWACRYPTTSTSIHHLYGVVTGAKEFLDEREFAGFSQAESMYGELLKFIRPSSTSSGTPPPRAAAKL